MLQAGQHHARALLLGKHEILDIDNAGHGVARMAKKFQADGAGVLRLAVHHPARAGDQAIAAFFLDARQAAEKFIGHVLSETFLAESFAGNIQALGALQGFAVGTEIFEIEAGYLGIVDFAHVVVDTGHFQPGGVGCDHAPRGQVVQRRAPQHGFFATGIHRDVAAHARGLGRGRIDRKNKTGTLGGFRHPLRHHARLGPDGGHRVVHARQGQHFDLADGLQLFGIDDRAVPDQWHRAAGVAGAAAPGDDGQAQIDATLDQARHLCLGVGREHHKRVFHPPVGGVGDVGHPAQAVKLDVVLRGQPSQQAGGFAAQGSDLDKRGIKCLHCLARSGDQLTHQRITLNIQLRGASLLDFPQPVVERIHQQAPSLGVVQHVVLQIGVALDDPDVAQHLVQHPSRAPGAALLAQPVQQLPGALAQQPDHDFPVGKRGVVVGNFADAFGLVRRVYGRRHELV